MTNEPAPMRCGSCGLPYDNVTHWPDGQCGIVPFVPFEPDELPPGVHEQMRVEAAERLAKIAHIKHTIRPTFERFVNPEYRGEDDGA
jgi:hypothetical protein